MELNPIIQILNNSLDRAKDRKIGNRDKKEKFLKFFLRLKKSPP